MCALPNTFTAHGHTWTSHTPGDPMPCDGERLVCILTRYNKDHAPCEIEFTTPRRAEGWTWGNTLRTCEIIGWRYADETQKPKPASPWRPIAEAPRDGTRLLVIHHRTQPLIGRWNTDEWFWEDDCFGSKPLMFQPTHFMPLPESP